MAQQIKLKRSAIAGKVPTTSSLDTGELAINTADGKLYFVRDDGTVQTLVTTNALVTGSLNINGPVTASFFKGDGSAITGVVSASYALTSSFALASLSASYAATASSADSFTVRNALTASGLSYPTTDGLFTGQVLQTNAAGTLAFGNVSAVFETIRNGEITTVVRGTPLYVSGAQGDQPICYRADATDPTKMPVTFVAMEDIAAGQGGRGITLGLITGIDMTGYSAGTQLWVDGLGVLTDVRPTGSTDIVQPIGIVTKTGNGGQLNVLNPGPVLLPNIVSGSTWVGNATNYPVAVPTSSFRVAFATSASYALTASAVNQLNQNVTINGNLTVFGSSSFTYVTSSQLNVDDSFISVNVFEPAERFGGLKVYDSGSFSHQATASLAWDSQRNHWVYVNASGSTYSGGGLLSGPRNTGSLGDETYPSYNTVVRGQGGDHLYDSNIKDNDTAVQVGIPLQVTGSLTTSGKVNIETVDNYGSDPDKFLAIVSNEVVYRTGAQLLSDIGGQTAGTFVQNAGGGGQARYILRYEDSNSATTSSIYEDTSGRIGINRTTPAYPLDISGSNLQIGSVVVGRGLTPNTALVVGSGSLTVFTGSSSLTVYGNNTLTNLTTGFANDAFGAYALNLTSTGTYNSAFGQSAGRRNNGSNNVFFGQFSGPFHHILTGGFNVFIGPLAGIYSSGSAAKNSGIGHSALYNLSDGIENTAIGSAALFDLTAGSGNIAFGYNTGRGITTGTGNVIVGNGITGLSSTLSNNIIIGDGQGNIKYRYADHNTTISGSLSIQGSTTVVQQGILVSGTTSLTVASISTGSYEGAFLDYVITSGSNKRAGTLTTVWTPSAIEWNDASTLDLGSTAGAEFTPALIGPNADLVLAVPAGTWTVKGHLRYM